MFPIYITAQNRLLTLPRKKRQKFLLNRDFNGKEYFGPIWKEQRHSLISLDKICARGGILPYPFR